jgi:perosamine synthetase
MTTGEGGMITTNDKDIAQKARMIRNHGQKERYFHEILGYNYRITDIAAAIGICQLKKLDEFNRKRIENAKFLTKGLSDIKGLIPPFVAPNAKHVFHQFTIRVTEDYGISRNELKERLKSKGITTQIYYPLPIHKQPLYQKLGYNDHVPISEKVAHEVLSLPVRPGLSEEDLKTIVQAL